MKKVKIERTILVPSHGYCMLWKDKKEVCPQLQIRKDPKKNLNVKCTILDKDLGDLNSYGIEMLCCEKEVEKNNVANIKCT